MTQAKSKYASSTVMEELMKKSPELSHPQAGDTVDGTITLMSKRRILVDIDGFSTGIISGKEAHDSAGTLKSLQKGDNVSAYVLEEEDEDGLVVLSLRRASQEKTWSKFKKAYESGDVVKVVPSEANKGGLLLNIDGIKGFIPVSQLAPLHYPRVDGADAAEILSRLQKLVGMELSVKVLNIDEDGGKLILSEKAGQSEARDESLKTLETGQKVKGKVSGIVKFGIFVAFDGLEGLVHISEIAWGHVKDPSDYGKLGDEVEVLVIGKEKDKISLSMKRLIPDPWIEASKKYKVGSIVEGEVSRITPFGAFVKLDDEINGLIHVSEVAEGENIDVGSFLKAGEAVKAKIINIDSDEHRVGLSLKALVEKKVEEKKEEEESNEKAGQDEE
ncbi:S1 RNA-binding domain-containing protein [Candidatus Peregrinibacteria bacterium]|jgi:small subunit ribosomal protein S1|nr:S1 RNA-binding domain-containing protein [Candidatus Peregrinibacteria bacterium]MBT4055530.1 S1 RNA-binding domain-containing protein [Candidatus Peregrinibacteria bacterium]